MTLDTIHAAIPHRPPFLMVDEIVAQEANRIICRKTFTGKEFFFAGHYPKHPIVPGVLLCEAAMQAGAVLMSSIQSTAKNGMPVVTRMNDVRFKHIVRPGDTIEIEAKLREKMGDAYFFDGKITCNGKSAVRLEFACMLAAIEGDA
jgi:3-hydroxyacyl-[acyl-carrier-protein] dehydratase